MRKYSAVDFAEDHIKCNLITDYYIQVSFKQGL